MSKSKIKTFINSSLIKSIIEIIVSMTSIASVILVCYTLREMQIQRDNTYLPAIVVESKQIDISWGDPTQFPEKNPFAISDTLINPKTTTLIVQNIGVGIAKNFKYLYDIDSINQYVEILMNRCTDNKYSVSQNGKLLTLNINGNKYEIGQSITGSSLYLLSEAKDEYKLPFLAAYLILINKIYEEYEYSIDLPVIKMHIEYEDVQGKKYMKDLSLEVEPLYLSADGKGNGVASYNIIMK